MTTTRRYVGGVGHTDASPRPLTATSFRDFVISWLNAPVTCALTRAAYHALPPAKQKAAKSTSYFCAANFGGDGTRKIANVTSLSLLVLDVDDPAAARHLLDTPLDDVLPFNHVLWTTLTSTEEAPRVRLVVDAEPLTPALYLPLIHIRRCRRTTPCRTRRSPYHQKKNKTIN